VSCYQYAQEAVISGRTVNWSNEFPAGVQYASISFTENTSSGLCLIDLVTGERGIVLEVRESNAFIVEGQELSLRYFAVTIVITFLLLLTIAIAADRIILQRLHDFDDQMMAIGGSAAKGGSQGENRITISGNDELGEMAQATNAMLDRIAEAEEGLQESERRYRAVVEDQSYLIIRFDRSMRVTFANGSMGRFLGRGSLRHADLSDIVGSEAMPSFHEAVKLFEEGGEAGEIATAKSDAQGRPRRLSWSLTAIRSGEGDLLEVQAVGRDVTDQLRMEAEVLEAQKMEAIGKLSAGVAHDFNNMFTSILAGTELLRLDVAGQEKPTRDLDELTSYLRKASMLARNLLIFSRGGEPVKRRVRVDEFLREVARISMVGSSIRYEVKVEPGIDDLEADPGQLFQAMNNLLANSRQAMGEDGFVTIEAWNEALDGGRGLVIAISDTGPGIPEAIADRIFDPFFTTKENGSGIGLAIVRNVVQAHGGRIVLKHPPVGARFEIHLPSKAAEAAKPAITPEHHSVQAKVLLMDDEEDLTDVISSLLSLHGLTVEVACDGAASLRLYAAAKEAGKPFDVVIMDLTIRGGMGGLEAVKALRQTDPQALVLVSSGYSEGSITQDFRRYGFDGAVPKPYEITELVDAIAAVMAARRMPKGQNGPRDA
jgi:PAS domain S-box-containing protein